MSITTTKIIQIFSDGSLNYYSTVIKKSKKINFYDKDHKNFVFNKKKTNEKFTKKKFTDFKTRYLKIG